jgi:hypothetical protein
VAIELILSRVNGEEAFVERKVMRGKSEIRNKFKFGEFLNGRNRGAGQAAGESGNQPRKSAKGAERRSRETTMNFAARL